jgi:purine-nucleoside phosphorylase
VDLVVCFLHRNRFGTKLGSPCYANVEFDRGGKYVAANKFMSQASSVITISDELSSEIATAILTRQSELNRDPRELLNIVLTVHDTLRDLSAKARASRSKSLDRFPSRAAN